MENIFYLIDRKRVKFHLMKVEQELLRKNSQDIDHQLKRKRKRKIELLNQYWKREQFPKNTEYPNRILPHIRDKGGTLCAMAYIIEKSGNKNLVEKLAKTNNLVDIDEVNKGPLIKWIKHSGLTKNEAARIQPAYGGPGFGGLGLTFILFVYITILCILEFTNFQLVKWLKVMELKKKIITHSYLVINSLILAGLLTIIFFELY